MNHKIGATTSSSMNYVKFLNSVQQARCRVLSSASQPPSQPTWDLRTVSLSTWYLLCRQPSEDGWTIPPTQASLMNSLLRAPVSLQVIHQLSLRSYYGKDNRTLKPTSSSSLLRRSVASSLGGFGASYYVVKAFRTTFGWCEIICSN